MREWFQVEQCCNPGNEPSSAGGTDLSHVAHFEHVKVVGVANYAATFPACRAVVPHRGVGTTGAGVRAGVPTLILSTWGDQTP